MLKRLVLFSAACTGFSLSTTMARADENVEQNAPRPVSEDVLSEDLQQLSFFQGPWQCEMTIKDESGQEKTIKGTSTYRSSLRGQWLEVRLKGEPSQLHPKGVDGVSFEGFDAGMHKFIKMGINSEGGYGHALSDGWQGNAMQWLGEKSIKGKKIHVRGTVTKEDDNKFTTLVEISEDGRTFAPHGQGVCTRE